MDEPTSGGQPPALSGAPGASPPGRRPTHAPEERVGSFVLVEKLGAGGVGEVWKARDRKLNRVVALKFISSEQRSSSPPGDLLREARAASALNHPNILTIFEIGESEGATYLAMEFVEGETLRARLKRQSVALEEALDIGLQVATGLAAAHRNGIVHRDLKPENIMLRADGYVKLVDFGLAKILPWTVQSTAGLSRTPTQTESGAIIGTVTYMSPEQARGMKVGPASDVFSFGILFYEMITGEHPFLAETAMDTLSAILNKEPQPIQERFLTVPEAVVAISARALEKESSRRYASAVELAEEIKRARAAALGAVSAATPAVKVKPLWMKALGGALMAGVLGLAAWRWHSPSSGIRINANVQSVAVMNFRAAPDDAGAAAYAQDLPDEVETALSKTGMQVVPHTSVTQSASNEDVKILGGQLGVDAVLEGNVKTFGTRFKVHVELVNVHTGFQLWSDSITIEGTDVLSGEQKAAAQIAAELRQALAAK